MGAWWAAVYGVAQTWTQLKRLSSSSSSSSKLKELQAGIFVEGEIVGEEGQIGRAHVWNSSHSGQSRMPSSA